MTNQEVLKKINEHFKINNISKKEYILLKKNFKYIDDTIKYKNIQSYKDLLMVYESKPSYKDRKSYYCHIYGYDKGNEVYNNLLQNTKMTLELCIKRHGDEEGRKRWKSYCEKQSYTNTLEYKAKKYGMSEYEFKKYNKSRAVTLELCIKRHGDEEGRKRWKSYCEKQSYTNTLEYLGEEEYKRINKLKGHTLESYIIRFGDEDLAKENLLKYWKKQRSSYSKISQELFWLILPFFNDEEKKHIHFAEYNNEYVVISKNIIYKYDFVCSSLKMCIEFHGDHYHGNPEFYKPNDRLKAWGQTDKIVKEKWKEDKEKKNILIEQRQYNNYIEIWENDYITDKKLIISKIGEYIEKCRVHN